MTVKEKREYLGAYQSLQKCIIGLIYEIEKWDSIRKKVNNAMEASGVHSGNVNSKVETGSVNVVDIIRAIQADIDIAEEQRTAILNIIREKSPRMRYAEILEMHFINGMSVSKIAKNLKKEEKTVANAITVALKELDI